MQGYRSLPRLMALIAVMALLGGAILLLVAWAGNKRSDEAQQVGTPESTPGLNVANQAPVVSTPAETPAIDETLEDFRPNPPILVLRTGRRTAKEFLDSTSWLGGFPTLGNVEWPRSDAGVPLHHVATIDLEELAKAQPETGLPMTGQLVFFIGMTEDRDKGRVLHISAPGPSEPPDDMPLPFGEIDTPYIFKGVRRYDLPRHYLRWPVTLHGLPPMDHEAEENEEVLAEAAEHVHAIVGPQSEFFLSTYSFKDQLPRGQEPWLWDSALRLANSLDVPQDAIDNAIERERQWLARAQKELPEKRARLERELADAKDDAARAQIENRLKALLEVPSGHEYRIEKLQTGVSDYEAFGRDMARWTDGKGPWSPLSDADLAELKERFAQVSRRGKGPHGLLYGLAPGGYASLHELADDTFRAIATGEPEVLELLPEDVRTQIESRFRLPSSGDNAWHQMFGVGRNVQDMVYHMRDKHLLLQLSHDDMMNWKWGDMGVFQFWISQEDLHAGRFDRAELTFEAH